LIFIDSNRAFIVFDLKAVGLGGKISK